MKTNPLRFDHLADFIENFKPANRGKRRESERFRKFTRDELLARDKVNLDITWLKDDSLDDPANLPAPHVLVAEIQEELTALLLQADELAVLVAPMDVL